jgi:hypothetical protein
VARQLGVHQRQIQNCIVGLSLFAADSNRLLQQNRHFPVIAAFIGLQVALVALSVHAQDKTF